jgi:LysR family transcriptional regulator, transcriptional activator of nhaA
MHSLNYHHLRYFWTIANEGTLRAAAKKLSISQPSISAQLKLLEETIGHPLFHRTGKGLKLTDTGRLVLEYAEDIFSTGRELMQAVQSGASTRTPSFYVGITDSLPKLIVREVLLPALKLKPAPRLVCKEGSLSELLPQLAAHRLDLVLADEPASAVHKIRIFNYPLGSCGITFCAAATLARQFKKNFPQSLNGAPMLLPGEHSSVRRAVDDWFHRNSIHPKIIGEFDDPALMKMFCREGLGIAPLHSVSVTDAMKTFQLMEVGDAPECRCHLHAVTAERRLKHPAILAITSHAQSDVFG